MDVSLDDLIKQRKQTGGPKRGGSRGRGGPARRGSSRGAFRSSPYGVSKPTATGTGSPWQQDVTLSGSKLSNAGVIQTGTKLYISNLDFGVSSEDIKEIFSEIGELKRSSVHYDKSGRSKGTAEVVYARKADALKAIQMYNNVKLDGMEMKIELISSTEAAVPTLSSRLTGLAPVSMKPSFNSPNRGRGGFRGRARGRGRGRGRSADAPMKTQAELDAELESYQSQKSKPEAMQT